MYRNPQSSRSLRTAAKVLLVWHVVVLVGAYFALPAYQRMHPVDHFAVHFNVVELTAAFDVLAMSLLIKGKMRYGILLAVATSTVYFGYLIIVQTQLGKPQDLLGVAVNSLTSYWDVALLVLLAFRGSPHSPTQHY